jgi:CheY-like chemotaxis protein
VAVIATDATDSVVTALPPGLRRDLFMRRCVARCDTITRELSALAAALRWIDEHDTLERAITVVDDSSPALYVLVTALAPLGVPVHAVTIDASPHARAALLGAGASSVHVVPSMRAAPEACDETRASVVVCDLHLGTTTGMDVIASLEDRGVRCVLVSSVDPSERSTVELAAARVNAVGVLRADASDWQSDLRRHVTAALDALAPTPSSPPHS